MTLLSIEELKTLLPMFSSKASKLTIATITGDTTNMMTKWVFQVRLH